MTLPAYKRPWYLFHAHLETIWPALLRRVPQQPYRRERIYTDDDDFLDLDWLQTGHKRLIIISHGLEGDTSRHYVTGMAKAVHGEGFDVLAWNFRGCGGEINRQPRFTHNGATEDLDTVISHALETGNYNSVALIGFSMGGNLTLLYLGREAEKVPDEVKAAVCFSVPCDLAAASSRLAEGSNKIYMKRFMRLMGHKVRLQSENFPAEFPCDDYHRLNTFADFDGRYTAPLHGFRDAPHYWQSCSSSHYLDQIRVPAWIVNANNDPFLAPSCFPDVTTHNNPLVTLISPQHGGHCGFASLGNDQPYWSERLAVYLLSSTRSSFL
jgi:predicted alpha/beta-fold hydrolase